MKRILLAFTALFLGVAVMAQQKPDDVMKINTDKYDFGKIKQGVPVATFFEIKNTSDKALVVENTWGSCGCTTPEKIEKPIQPGETTNLKVNYNAAALGHFDKTVSIKLAGINDPKVVSITGEVLGATEYDTYQKTQPKDKSKS
ncbi:MAG TPA: DUF1573 domain-containing protein [Chitinophagaceae bacterium]